MKGRGTKSNNNPPTTNFYGIPDSQCWRGPYKCMIRPRSHCYGPLCSAALSRVSRMSDSLGPMDCQPPGSSLHGDDPCKHTGEDCCVLLQGIFPTQGSNPYIWRLLYCRQVLYPLGSLWSPMQDRVFLDLSSVVIFSHYLHTCRTRGLATSWGSLIQSCTAFIMNKVLKLNQNLTPWMSPSGTELFPLTFLSP